MHLKYQRKDDVEELKTVYVKQHDRKRMCKRYNQQSTFLSDHLDHDMHL